MLAKHTRRELSAVLIAWRSLRQVGWPDLLPELAQRAALWSTMEEEALQGEVERLLAETSAPSCKVRLFWKFAPDLQYRGFNAHFLSDSGLSSPQELLGQTDFHPRIGWSRQAAKYRADDTDLISSKEGWKDLVERQDQGDATVWLHTAKAAIRGSTGDALGVLGMYEIVDAAVAAKLLRKKP